MFWGKHITTTFDLNNFSPAYIKEKGTYFHMFFY